MLLERGSKSEATVLVYGDALPTPSAALLNGVMCRALDFCDSMVPDIHIGSLLIPTVMAAAELKGGCTDSEFLTALIVGAETSARLSLTDHIFSG